jgi:transcription factor MYB, plant
MAYALTNAASNFDMTPESLRSVLPLINWDKIAAMYLPGRSGAECESWYLYILNTFLTGAFRCMFYTFLYFLQLVSIFMGNNILTKLSFCLIRWLNCDDPLINHNAWTKQEEKRLILIVQEKGMCNWINIAATLGTQRTPFQCLARYQRSLNPYIINKAWTKEEDLQLKAAVETFGDNWQLVSTKLDGRTGSQCSNR